jgi:hypothetical protein
MVLDFDFLYVNGIMYNDEMKVKSVCLIKYRSLRRYGGVSV